MPDINARQASLDSSSKKLYQDFLHFSTIMDNTQGERSIAGTVSLETLQNSIIDFYILCENFKDTNQQVAWNNKNVNLSFAVTMITEIISKMQTQTQYKFLKVYNWLNSQYNKS